MFEDGFDSPELEGLRGIRLPDPVDYTPQTTGWWILGVVVALVLVGVAYRIWRWWKRGAYRRRALAQLDELEQRAADAGARRAALAQVPVLVKHTALDVWPRERVGSLSGSDWLAFLDDTYGGESFATGAGRHLPDLAYATTSIDADERAALFDAVRDWIVGHRA